MNEMIKRLQDSLDKGKTIVYLDKDFSWKDIAIEVIGESPDYELTDDPKVIELYRMYEFSDRFIVLDESDNYGSIWNYVRSGLITAEDALECM